LTLSPIGLRVMMCQPLDQLSLQPSQALGEVVGQYTLMYLIIRDTHPSLG
jgi:hypothetical protein